MSLDYSELQAFDKELGQIPEKYIKQIPGILAKGGMKIKTAMQKDLRKSKSFRPAARSIDYETIGSTGFGATHYAVEVGPNKSRHPAAALAGIAYFGGAKGGGGTVRDPAAALAEEAPVVEDFMLKAMEGLL